MFADHAEFFAGCVMCWVGGLPISSSWCAIILQGGQLFFRPCPAPTHTFCTLHTYCTLLPITHPV